ncbi:peroxidase 65-like [Mangifera indica]|uniref:peroxidase 65-like n=1 Tax=Mangifera indica TaxID=29780 RepID=UPI001CF97663|nr:peroxidase 65-like [Mangifera indica]
MTSKFYKKSCPDVEIIIHNVVLQKLLETPVTAAGALSYYQEFMPRIYDYNKAFDIDPTMDPQFVLSLQGPCPKKKFDPTVFALNDVTTPSIFDNSYCRNLQKGMGLLATDQMLILNPMTGDYVKKMAENQNVFFDSFVSAMIKLGSIGVQEGWRDYTGLRFFQWLSG